MTKQYPLPLVTVICTCYNHAQYVEEAIYSVLNQTYPNIQLIVVDNASQDESVAKINDLLLRFPNIQFIPNKTNIGICKAFNNAVKLATGKYLIDLAADDVLCLDRIALQVSAFEKLPDRFGILYSNVEEITPIGKHLCFSIKPENAPGGEIFGQLLEKHFLPSPSTMFKKEVFDSLGGYNESLAFEDFDYWVRCARNHHFHYLDIISTKKRILPHSLSSQFQSVQQSERMLASTYETFLWAKGHIRNEIEKKSLAQGISYYFRQSVLLRHFEIANKFREITPLPFHPKTLLADCLFFFHQLHRRLFTY